MKKWTFSYHILLVAFVSLLASCSEQSDWCKELKEN